MVKVNDAPVQLGCWMYSLAEWDNSAGARQKVTQL